MSILPLRSTAPVACSALKPVFFSDRSQLLYRVNDRPERTRCHINFFVYFCLTAADLVCTSRVQSILSHSSPLRYDTPTQALGHVRTLKSTLFSIVRIKSSLTFRIYSMGQWQYAAR